MKENFVYIYILIYTKKERKKYRYIYEFVILMFLDILGLETKNCTVLLTPTSTVEAIF